MVYIISGRPRTGTSMMMEVCQAGGMELAYDKERDTILERYSDDLYRANPRSLYEIAFWRYGIEGFPSQYEGKVIKVFWWGLPHLSSSIETKVVFMTRDAEEVRQSYEALDPMLRPRFKGVPKDFYETPEGALVLNYRDVVKNPHTAVEQLYRAGWPIRNLEAAAAAVDPSLYRFRRGETITEGL